MKNPLLVLLAMQCFSLASAQTLTYCENESLDMSEQHDATDSLTIFVGGLNINDAKTEFLEMQTGQPSFGSFKRIAFIDYGQKNRGLRNHELTDAFGHELVFSSDVDILNFLYDHGWDLVSVTKSSATINNIFFFRRKDH